MRDATSGTRDANFETQETSREMPGANFETRETKALRSIVRLIRLLYVLVLVFISESVTIVLQT